THQAEKPNQFHLHTHSPADISSDDTIKEKVAEEHAHSDAENLLDKSASKE
ncbi:MAG: hypothetical protein H0V39_08430, partial [Nitrosomonas sp.]|nr:hypothetical protein [Nitrosomonas sp.]